MGVYWMIRVRAVGYLALLEGGYLEMLGEVMECEYLVVASGRRCFVWLGVMQLPD